jgi:hypothetical protein
MNVASLELCKELYELSGWITPDFSYVSDNIRNDDERNYARQFRPVYEGMAKEPGTYRFPAYDLGYLLRKLPAPKGSGNLKLELSSDTNQWYCYYGIGIYYGATADTPEDAAAKLAIVLFKQGVLSK